MIEVKQLTKSFNKLKAIDGVSFHLKKKEIFGIVGPDGAGKTTLLRIICGLITPDSGEVRTIGFTPGNFGYMPQRFSLYGDLTVMENLVFFGSMYTLKKDVIIKRSEEILELTGLIPFKNRLADKLSGGMKQKLALTCSLVTRPELLILDEPTYGVDPEFRKEFWKILYRLNGEGMTILVTTPYMDEAELCNRVAFISEGRITALETPGALRRDFPYQVWEVVSESKNPELFSQIGEVKDSSLYGDKYRLIIDQETNAAGLIRKTLDLKGYNLKSLQKVSPSMEDVFVILAGR